ncbi:MAG: redox-sensing transcriptional repressor Rex [Dehalococcoidia bacterium]
METQPPTNTVGSPAVPEVVIMRLPQYVRVLTRLRQQGVEVVNSQQLGRQVQMTPAQIRKDLSYFGRLGKQGRGYTVSYLLEELRHILGLDKEWRVGLVGVGRLGRAILSYPGFTPEGFTIVAAFDADPRQVGQVVASITVQPMHQMSQVIQATGIRIAIVAVPASHAQEVIDRLVECDVHAIVNYAPIAAQIPPGVKLRNIDPVLGLQSMTYYLRTRTDIPPVSTAT